MKWKEQGRKRPWLIYIYYHSVPVSIVTDYGLDDRGSNPERVRGVFF
jgi:hypothetical protein